MQESSGSVFVLREENRKLLEGEPTAKIGWGVIVSYALPVLLVGLGLAMLVLLAGDWATKNRLQAVGQSVVGTVTGSRASGGRNTAYYLAYTYVVAGQAYNGEQLVLKEGLEQYPKGATVRVRYLPSDPGVSQPGGAGLGTQAIAWTDLLLPGLVPAVMVLLGAWVLSSLVRSRRLARRGRLLEARLTHSELTTRGSGSTRLIVNYQFSSAEGKTLTGRVSSRYEPDIVPPQVGDRAAVIYLDDKHYKLL